MRSRSPRLLLLLTLSLLAAGGLAGGLACASSPDDIGLADGRLRPCPSSPNCVNSEDEELASSIEPFAYDEDAWGDGRRAFRSLVDFIEAEPRVELVTVEEGYAHFVFRTPLLRFRDDVELRLDEEAGVVHVRSASRVGWSDLGANRERIESIRRLWKQPAAE